MHLILQILSSFIAYSSNIIDELSVEEILENVKDRDYRDSNRPMGALKKADDAIYIDSTNLTIEEVIKKMQDVIEGE